MGIYIAEDSVRIRLLGKVRFTDDRDEENKFQNCLLRVLIAEAESDVENDLSPRYMAPFQTKEGLPFAKLPERPTKQFLRTLCELKAVTRVLETDFGRGGAADSEKYTEKLQERYDAMVKKVLEKKDETCYLNWKYPPLMELRLALHNTEADDGYSGQVLTTGQGDGEFPKYQINDPSETFWTGEIDGPEDFT